MGNFQSYVKSPEANLQVNKNCRPGMGDLDGKTLQTAQAIWIWQENNPSTIGSNQKPKMSIQRSKDSLIAMFDVCLWQRWWFTQQHKRTRHHCASKVARPDATVSHHVARSTMLKGRSGKRVPLKLGIWANMVNGRQNEFSVHMQSSNTWQEPWNTSKGRSEEP